MNPACNRTARRTPATTAALAAAVLTLVAPPAARAAEVELGAAQRGLHAAVMSGSVSGQLEARAQFATLAAADAKSAAAHYWTALADWRVVPRLVATDKEKAGKLCQDGLVHAARALELDPKHAEAQALRSSLLGLSLTFDPAAMMTIGPQVEEAMARAIAMAPKNPRVRLLDAIGTLNKPAFIGGGAGPALERFRAAAPLFEEEAARDSSRAVWGRDEVYLWAGRAAMKLGDAAGAAGWYRKALAVSPDYAWVRHSLLPEAEKAAAATDSGRTETAAPAPR